MNTTATDLDLALIPGFESELRCACAHYDDGSTHSRLCPVHAEYDPCLIMSHVTGKRRKGSIRNGSCSNCGWAVV